MTAKPYIVALEGPCCAGKTTLGRLLVQELREMAVTFVPCYADHAGGGRHLLGQHGEGRIAGRSTGSRAGRGRGKRDRHVHDGDQPDDHAQRGEQRQAPRSLRQMTRHGGWTFPACPTLHRSPKNSSGDRRSIRPGRPMLKG